MNTRIKEIRKSLHLSQRDFGKRLGVQDTAISKIESGERNLTDQMLLAVCREYNVNEEWLRTGNGDMLIHNDSFIASSLVHQYGLDEDDQRVIESYLNLGAFQRKIIKDYIIALAASFTQPSGVGTYKISARDGQKEVELSREQREEMAKSVEHSKGDDLHDIV